MSNVPWWRGAVIYQIYPRSFMDSNGDGVGDLVGIMRNLDYVAQLGVDAIWISPFYKSPMRDFGYDISDYRAVDPLFGTMRDFDELVARAHKLGLRVLIDQVLSHSSSDHPWFNESRSSRDNDKSDWYVWADPRVDGTPPNNWLSVFGGPAWEWDAHRQQYYLHNFLTTQPDLNFHNPDVPAAMLGELRFWLERRVDGVRLDSINFCYHDRRLRNNPPKPREQRVGRGFSADSPYAYQVHEFDNTRPENLAFLERLRRLLDQYPEVASLGEVSAEDSLGVMAEYTSRRRLHMSYSFELLGAAHSARHVRATVDGLAQRMREGWPCWAISNHDSVRVRSRWLAPDAPAYAATMLTALACSLRGSACVYQGEELGLPEASVPFEALRDPYGIAFWPDSKGRDGCRTPMPWSRKPGGGFTTGRPWLPIDPRHLALNVADQAADPGSALNRIRDFLRWRRSQPALRDGDMRFLDAPEPVLAFVRSCEAQMLLMVFNLGDADAKWKVPAGYQTSVCADHGLVSGQIHDHVVELPPYGALFAQCVVSTAEALATTRNGAD